MSNKIVLYKILLHVLVCVFTIGFISCDVTKKDKHDDKIQKETFFVDQDMDEGDDSKPNDEPSKASKLYLIGGSATGIQTSDVWNSEDGVMWSKINTSGKKFTARYGHQVVFFKGKMYLIGGYDLNDSRKNDVWSSRDGVMWKEETAEAQFPARANYRVVVFKNKLYLIGGYVVDGTLVAKNDIWSSTDGVRWEEVRTNGDKFSPRSGHQVVVFKGKMFVIGGSGAGKYKNDVWISSDGVTWRQVTAGAQFSPYWGHKVVVFRGKMYLIGGRNNAGGGQNDVWSTSNGVGWRKVNTNRPIFTAHEGHHVVVFRNKMYLIGGYADNGNTNDVWSSRDGVTWRQEETVKGKKFPARSRHQVVVFPAE